MKSILLFLVSVFTTDAALAQLAITQGAQLSMAGPVQLTLNNTSLINNGSFAAGASTVRFTGNGPSSIGGSGVLQFHELEVNKTANAFVLLLRPINISEDLLFISGLLNLNSFNANLGSTGVIMNESDSARVIGANGGEILFNVNLNAPAQVNPGNLGLFITTSQNLGNVTIRRGHKPQVNNTGGAFGIQRYYKIVPTNNTALNATLAFKYFDGELNGLPENSLSLFQSDDNINWKNLGFKTRNTTANFVEKNTIGSLSRFTLFKSGTPLPVHFISASAKCESNTVVVSWKTAQEQNIQFHSIERSDEGNIWTAIGQLSPARIGGGEISYTFRDNAPLRTGQYRIAEYDFNGTPHYSSIVRTSCTVNDIFTVLPNPVRDKLYINIVAAGNSVAVLQLFDSKGALVKQQTKNMPGNSNQFIIDMSSLAKGIYYLSVEWNNGRNKKTTQVAKN